MKRLIKSILPILVCISISTVSQAQVIFEDDFSSGNLNNWTILSGSWDVINQEMCAIADGSTITANTGTLTSYIFETEARFEAGLAWGIDFRYIDPYNRIRLDFAPGAPNQLNVNIYENGVLAAQPYTGSCSQYGGYSTQHYCKFVVDGSYFEVYFGNDPDNLDLLCTYTYPAFDSGTIRYEAWGYPPNVMSCFDNVLITSEDEWVLVYEEDFSSDPGWLTNNGSHFYWNSSEENYYVRIEDNLNEYGVIQIPEMDGSFKIEYDAKMTQNDWSSALIFGIYDDEIAYKPGGVLDTLSSLVLMFDHADGGTGFTIHSYTPPTVCNYHNHWCGTCLNQWYHVVIEYDAEVSTASYVVTLDGSTVSSNSINITGTYQGLMYLGVSRRWHYYVQGATTTGYVDNVELWVLGTPPPPLTVTYPNGGEVWEIGDTPTITWEHSEGFNGFDVLLSRNNGQTWESLVEGLCGMQIEWTWNSGVTPPPSDCCLIKIVGHYEGNQTHDTSNNVFSIVGGEHWVEVSYPNGGEVWEIGDTPTITWEHGGGFCSFDVLLSRDEGTNWETLDTGLYGFAIDWTWNAGVTPPPSDECLVKIVGHYEGNQICDNSDGVFSIIGESPFTPDEFTEALWHFNEAAGTYTAFDATGNGYDMALEDGAEFSGAGLYGGCADIIDPDAKINSDYLIGNGWDELTIDAHIKLIEFNPDENPVVYRYEYYTTNPAYLITITPSGEIYAGVYQNNGGHTFITTDPVINLHIWYYIQMTWTSGGELKIFVDGALVESAAAGIGSIRNSTHQLTIGWFHDTGYGDFYSNGFIDEVRISDIDRSEPPPPPPPVIWGDDFEDGNFTQNPEWTHIQGEASVIMFGGDYCLDVHMTPMGPSGVIEVPIPPAQEFTLEFDVHKRPGYSGPQNNVHFGVSEGDYVVDNGFQFYENDCSNIRTLWNTTQQNQVSINSFDERWQHIIMIREASGAWTIIWDAGGPNETAITGQDEYGNLINPHLWLRCDGFYSGERGAYFDDFMMFSEPPPPPIEITLTPYNPPIVIPPGGDAFAYNIAGANSGSSPAIFDVWVNIEVPGGHQFTLLGPVYDITMAAGSSIERDRTVFVPGNAPAGEYICMGMIGTYPWNVVDMDAFPFFKAGADGIWKGSAGWINSGEPFPGEDITAEGALPEKFALQGAFPNPFNPATNLSFSLPEPGEVSLVVYDVRGREVVRLVDGWTPAGNYQMTFDASQLSSGLYFARLVAGDFQQTQKIMLLK